MQLHSQTPFEEENSSTFNIKYEIIKYLNYWPWFVLSMLLFLLGSFIYLRYTPKIYSTHAKIKILDENEGIELPTTALIVNRSNINLENEMEILTSYPILERVVERLGLCARFFELGRIKSKPLVNLPFNFKLSVPHHSLIKSHQFSIIVEEAGLKISNEKKDIELVFPEFDTTKVEHELPFELLWSSEYTLEELIGREFEVSLVPKKWAILDLKSRIKIDPVGQHSDLLGIHISGQNTLQSERIINTLIEVFNLDDVLDRQQIWERTIKFVNERFVDLSKELDSIESYKMNFKVDNNLVDVSTDVLDNLKQQSQSSEKLFQVENQILVSELIQTSLLAQNTSVSLLPTNIGIENANVNTLLKDFNAMVLQYQKLKSSAGAMNPAVVQLEANLEDFKSNINKSISAYIEQLTLTRDQLSYRNETFQSKVSAIPEKEQKLRAIERQQNIKETLYIFLLQKKEEASVNLAVTEPTLKVVEYGISDFLPISPKPRIVYLAAFLLGLATPFCIIYVILLFDSKVNNKLDMDVLAKDIPVIAEIPQIKDVTKTVFSDPNDRSILAESFRILTTNMDFILPSDSNGKVIFCTSTIKGEGKTFISLNFSLAMASLNKKVLLIGGDLRNPQLHTYAKINKNQTGLSNYLIDPTLDWKACTLKVFKKQQNHDTLFSGAIPPNPAFLLANGNFETLLKEARAIYDYIVIDLAPTILVTDTLLIADQADATICAVRANHTDKKLIPFSVNLCKTERLKNMSYVINGVKENRSYGYSYNYGYNYGYGEL